MASAAPSPQNEVPSRVRFAKGQLEQLALAVERVDAAKLDGHMRALALEDELAEAREATRRWRVAYEQMQALLASNSTISEHERLEQLDVAVRSWVGRV